MEYSTNPFNLNVRKFEFPYNEFDWLPPYEDPSHFGKAWELPPVVDRFYDFSSPPITNHHYACLDSLPQFDSVLDFPEFSNEKLHLPEDEIESIFRDILMDEKPLNTLFTDSYNENNCENDDNLNNQFGTEVSRMMMMNVQTEYSINSSKKNDEELGNRRLSCGRKRSAVLELDEIQKHFDVPITKAAKQLNVGLTLLKKRCRELNIMRWPHRKLKSLKSLITNVKEMGMTNEIIMLEEHKKLLEILPDMELTDRTKRLRQACFKANYKKRRCLAITNP